MRFATFFTIKNGGVAPQSVQVIYYCAGAIAETGQMDAHVPHDTHFVGSITHLPSGPTLIAATGHMPMHE